MIETLVQNHYDINIHHCTKLDVGAGSNTYHIKSDNGEQYILKNANINDANNPQNEPALCAFLLSKDIPVSEFVPDVNGNYIWQDGGELYHMQKFVSGKNYDMHGAPDWLITEMPRMLGKIHAALKDYQNLPVGIGEDFFHYMTPSGALHSYEQTRRHALQNNETAIADDLEQRIDMMSRFQVPEIDLCRLTCGNTHGDYFISQIICGPSQIAAVIDWTTACIHPLVWEIIRSYIYGSPGCKNGNIRIPELIRYTENYMRFSPLTAYDLKMMPYVFYYQISVCDYYNQYFQSTADNRYICLNQAVLSTKLMKWFEAHSGELSEALLSLH